MKSVVRRCVIVCVIGCVSVFNTPAQQTAPISPGWDAMEAILKRIVPPTFPQKKFDVVHFGAVADGTTDCSAAFQKAVEKCHDAGGGIVVVPQGVFLTGPITLKSNVNLYLSKGATIRFSTDPKKYLPPVYVRWEGIECMNYSPLIYAYGQENIAITGEGVLDGRGSNETWWNWKGKKEYGWVEGKPDQNDARKKLGEMGEEEIPVKERIFGDGSYLRPNFFEPYRCTNVLVEGVKFINSPMWFLNPVLCSNVTVIGVTTEGRGPNNDGCDPESCTNVLIKNCTFDNGDDCIAIKSGRNRDGRRVNVPCTNIVVQGCRMKDGHGGISLGSECSGGIAQVYAEQDTMDSPNLERMLRIKTNSIRGGIIENIFFRNIKIGQVADAVMQIDFYYEEGDAGKFTPVVRNIELRNIESEKSKLGIWIKAYDRSPVSNVRIEHCTFNHVAQPNVIENVQDLSLIDVTVHSP